MTDFETKETATTQADLKRFRTWGTVAGFGIGFLGYGLGWPMWLVFVLFFGVPFASLIIWLVTGSEAVRRYRFLFVVYGLAAVPAVYEMWVTKTVSEPVTEFLNIETGPGEADLLFQYDFPRYLGELYPDRSVSLFARGFQMQMCVGYRREGRRVPICERLGEVSLEQARRYLKAAVDTGTRSEENVLYHYVLFLSNTGASEEEVNAAFAEWRWNYPYSQRPDPRRRVGTAVD